jgi:hypothetical protein
MNDFDFYTGTWDVTNRRRTDFLEETCLLAGCHFSGSARLRRADRRG